MTVMQVALLAAASAAEAAAAMVAMETLGAHGKLPKGWVSTGRAPRGKMLELTFAVRQQGLAELHEVLMNVSRPSSPHYGRHLSLEQVSELTAPHPAHIEAVTSFLRSHGAEPRAATPNSDFILAEMPVEVAEGMLSAEYSRLVHGRSGVEVHRVLGGYHLPEAVAAAVDFVAPTVHVPGVRRAVQQVDRGNRSFNMSNTPKNLRRLYSIGQTEGRAGNNRQAVTAFLEQNFSGRGLNQWWRRFCRGISCGKDKVRRLGDGSAPASCGGVEAMLDIETITGVAGNVFSEFWGFAGRSPDNVENEPFLKWLTRLGSVSDDHGPKIFSTSYGEDEASWSLPAAERLNVEFQKAGARGISLLYASGDEGANCEDGLFVPEGPGSSPYVTAVGGTAPAEGFPWPGGETAIGLSSGGFSNYWKMPDWQREAVQKYLGTEGLPDSSRGYNTSGRAYPDISAQATQFVVWTGCLKLSGVGGTSAATPTASGIFSLLNDVRLAAGKSTLGFLNPLVYEHASAFNDITTGSNVGCNFSLAEGWPAKVGWDAVTGVGTPNFAKLAQVVLALPAGRAARLPDVFV